MLFEKQKYQEECVDNIMKVLRFTNNLSDLSNLKDGIKNLHSEKKIPITATQDECRLDVLMETGTGKTFTYLKAMYEMNKHYKINKFVIFVPRLAIRSGVIQNIELTSDHFFQEYGKRLEKYTYEGNLESVNNYLRNQYELSVLILTSASIASKNPNGNKSIRILTRKTNESSLFPRLSPLEAVNKLNPVVFLDEPHLLKGDSFVKAYKKHFSNSLLIRFGATYPKKTGQLSNVVYVLDSITSLRSHLVKKIRVSTFADSRFAIRFHRIISPNEVEVSYLEENTEKTVCVHLGDDIGAKTGKVDYAEIHITKIEKNNGRIHLSDRISVNVPDYTLVDETIREMVRDTIRKHFEKEKLFFDQGIKTLSLFFIPNINDFRGDNPRIKKIFEEEYKKQRKEIVAGEISKNYKNYLEKDFNEDGNLCIHGGYFSGDSDSDEKIGKEVDKILKRKTELLSTKEPLRFIFSVWALQEGWDNPNIFNICKLSATSQDTSRRQQVGRGLRIAVDTNGIRQTLKKFKENDDKFYEVNMLDMFVSSQEGDFIKDIQDEITSNSFAFGGNTITQEMLEPLLDKRESMEMINFLCANGAIEFSKKENAWIIQNISLYDFMIENKSSLPDILCPKYAEILKLFNALFNIDVSSVVENANKIPEEVTIRQNHMREFKELWKTITRKAKIVYRDIQEDRLIDAISEKFNRENIKKPHITKKESIYHHERGKEGEIEAKTERFLDEITFFDSKNNYSRFIFDFACRARLPIPFVIRLFAKLKISNIKNDPNRAERLLLKIIVDEIHRSVVESVGYEFDSTISIDSQNVFYDEAGNPKKKIRASLLGRFGSKEVPAEHYLYDKIRFDSKIEERGSMKSKEAKTIENVGEVIVFAKLPRISIPTPYHHYNPDFAYYIKTAENRKIFFVVETKGYDSENAIPEDERSNIAYAKKFFNQLNKEVGGDVDVIFKQRINRQNLSDLLREIGENS